MPRCENVFRDTGRCASEGTVRVMYGRDFDPHGGVGLRPAGPTLDALTCSDCASALMHVALREQAPIYLQPLKEARR